MSIIFTTNDELLNGAYQNALRGLRENLHPLPDFDPPGAAGKARAYRGIWLECGPLEGLAGALYGAV